MKEVKVGSAFSFNIDYRNGVFFLDDKQVEVDIKQLSAKSFSVIFDHRSFNVELVELNKSEKKVVLKVNNKSFDIEIKDEYDALLHQLGLDKVIAPDLQDLKAPMPGLVLRILVKEGDQIRKGDSLIVLEAMKMENILKATSDGVIKNLLVVEGDKVEKNQLLISFQS